MASFTSSFHPKNKPCFPLVKSSARIPTSIILLQMSRHSEEIRQLHARLVVSGLLRRYPNTARLLEAYIAVSDIDAASLLFNAGAFPDAFGYNIMMRRLTSCNRSHDAIILYQKLLLDGLKPDNHSYTFVLKACSTVKALSVGKQVHCQMVKAGKEPDTHIHSSLIHMYASSGSMECAEFVLGEFSGESILVNNSIISGYTSQGEVDKARKIFNNMKAKDVASWSAMITGYTRNNMHKEALDIFREMTQLQVPANESTLVSSLSACAHLGALDQGRWMHTYIDKMMIKISITLGTALIDMYAKCGNIKCAYEIFQRMPQRDVVSWGAIISGFSIHGHARKCFELFDEMLVSGTRPNGVVFVAVLSACSHCGYVELGFYYYDQMVRKFGIRPCIEHYGCMVDLLSRAGNLEEAERVIISMPEKPNSVIWGMFLSGCRNYSDVRRGIWATGHLLELEPHSGDRYKLAGLMLANAGQHRDATEIKKHIQEKEMKTTSGSSYIEVEGSIYEFRAGKIDHNKAGEICSMWDGIDE